jgi:PEP-CTERM motif
MKNNIKNNWHTICLCHYVIIIFRVNTMITFDKGFLMPKTSTLKLVALTFFMFVGTAQSGTISSLYSTGAGANLTDGQTDTNWTVSGPGITDNSSVYAATTAGSLGWGGNTTSNHLNNGVSTWISPTTPPGNHSVGNFTYRTTFDLTSLKLDSINITGKWESDNKLQSIVLNAGTANQVVLSTNTLGTFFNSVTVQPNWDTSPTTKNFSFASFLGMYFQGVNTLDFIVNNTAVSPTGLRVEFTTQSAIPEPTALVLLGIAAVGFAATRRRKI